MDANKVSIIPQKTKDVVNGFIKQQIDNIPKELIKIILIFYHIDIDKWDPNAV